MRLRLGLSDLIENEFRYNFQDAVNLICYYDEGIETS